MRPHYIQSHYASERVPVPLGEELEFNILPNADTMHKLSWLTRIYRISVNINSTVDSIQVLDGEMVSDIPAVDPVVGYDNELEKVCARRSGAVKSLGPDLSLPRYTTYWNDWAIIGYTDGVEVQWKPHTYFTLRENDESPRLYNFDDGTRILQPDAIFTFFGSDYQMFSSSGDGSEFFGTVVIEPDPTTSAFWPYRRADTTNPVRNSLTGAQLIFDAAELNIR